ncbi:MAG TPA: Uma2 family endonuclease [Ktedonobacterales bacterium]|jgi:Uma2 family endonuclease
MRQDVIAPWAEVVPNAPFPMTIAQMQALPDDNWQYELVEGRLVRMPGSGNKASAIVAYLIADLVAFVRTGRLEPLRSKEANAIPHLAPDLVAEVASPSQSRPAMAAKARLFLAAGVQLVWMIWPDSEQVGVWRPGSDAPVVTLTAADHLDGLDVLPGFAHPVVDLFTE